MVGDRHAMRIAGQVVQNMFWSAERPLGVDNPFIVKRCSLNAANSFGSDSRS
jgi:hypothetical protein